MKIVDAGKFSKIYDPSARENEWPPWQWHINDHCFIRGKDGTWHMFGITNEPSKHNVRRRKRSKPFAHATAKSLLQRPWDKKPPALTPEWKKWREIHLWAPHVILHNGTYHMFYCAGDRNPTKYKLYLATSLDLETWKRHPENPMVVDGFHARDPMVLRVGDEWVMYYTATSEPSGGNHVVAYRTSDDLITWGERNIAFLDPHIGTRGGPTESPFVVRRGDYYYLFIGPRRGYVGTDVFRSKNPFNWSPKDIVGHIESHAAEVVRDVDGQWYISHCGVSQGGVYLAPLYWNDSLDDAETSMPIPK